MLDLLLAAEALLLVSAMDTDDRRNRSSAGVLDITRTRETEANTRRAEITEQLLQIETARRRLWNNY